MVRYRVQTSCSVLLCSGIFGWPSPGASEGDDHLREQLSLIGRSPVSVSETSDGPPAGLQEGNPMSENDVTAIPHLDLERYLGDWFEVGRLPLKFEDRGARDITASYSIDDDGSVRVDNRCINEEGSPTQAIGRAVPDGDSTSRLKVSFLPEGLRWIPFTTADYWVLRIDGEYRYALVGTPDHKYLWLLARDPGVSQEVEEEYLAQARRQGFNLGEWIRPVQSGTKVSDEALAD